jgi:hypothetical protein
MARSEICDSNHLIALRIICRLGVFLLRIRVADNEIVDVQQRTRLNTISDEMIVL